MPPIAAAVAAKRARVALGFGLPRCRHRSGRRCGRGRPRPSSSPISIAFPTTSSAWRRACRGPISAPTLPSGSGTWTSGSSCSRDTLLIAYLGTLLGALGAFVAVLLAPAPISSSAAGSASSRRRFLEFCRTVPEIVFALLFVVAFGLGADAGRAGARDPYHGRARQAVRRGRREHRHEAGRGRDRDRRRSGGDHPLRRPAAGACRISPPMRCCASRSTCAAPRSWASSAPAASGRTSWSRSASSTTPTSRPSWC